MPLPGQTRDLGWRRVAAAITTDDATNLHTIKNAIVFISEHILVQFGVSK